MIIFFTILFVIVGVNAVIVFMNLNRVAQKGNASRGTAETAASKIYPIDVATSKYKKAI